MRIATTGSREYRGYKHERQTLMFLWDFNDDYHITELAVGDCPSGFDKYVTYWAQLAKANLTVYHANWRKHGKAAGPIRNREMLEDFKPDLLVAFPGGKGTHNCMRTAWEMEIPVWCPLRGYFGP